MIHQRLNLIVAAAALSFLGGCAVMPGQCILCQDRPGEAAEKGPKTLLSWEVGPKDDKNDDDEKKDGANDKKNGDEKKNGANGKKNGKAEEPNTIATDRPDFVEATHAVGKGRVQIEAGYTYTRDGNAGERATSHSYPETLVRIGMFADWFELRIGQNFGSQQDIASAPFIEGGQDLYLGFRFDLTEQKGIFPEASLILQANLPTGHQSFTGQKILPGFNLLYGWEIIEDRLSLAGSTQINRRLDEDGHHYTQYAQAFTMGFKWTKRLGQYTEWFTLVPCGATASETRTQHYLDGGFTYLITDNFQLDIRAGVGLNRAADDFFAGSGFGIRF